jgi:negative regulator of flagellin synthesis FlgM
MEVRGLGSVSTSAPVGRSQSAGPASEPAPVAPESPRDEVEISSVGKMLDDASRTPGIREQRLARIKAAIEAGTYETPEKLELALNRMLEQIQREEKGG